MSDRYQHFFLTSTKTVCNFTIPQTGRSRSHVWPNRKTHGQKLLDELERAGRHAATLRDSTCGTGLQFLPLEVDQNSELEIKIRSIGREDKGVRVLNARDVGGKIRYLLAVKNEQVASFRKKLNDYLSEDTKTGVPKNRPLACSIDSIQSVSLESYWTTHGVPLPSVEESLWWEVWLESEPDDQVESWFRKTANEQRIQLSEQKVRFPNRVVILAYATLADWEGFPGLLKHLAEFRRASIVAGEFTELAPKDQAEFVDSFLNQLVLPPEDSVRICILDTGIDRGHSLLERSIASSDLYAWNDDWRTNDHNGHGTEMAGVCLYGALEQLLYNQEAIDSFSLKHRLESVKILPPTGENSPPDYGPITAGSVAMVEYAKSEQARVFCLAVTAVSEDHWRPSLWSATLDQITSGALDNTQRLMVVSAGNIRDDVGIGYPQENYQSSAEDPSQAWNVLTVGAFTNKAWQQEFGASDYSPIALPGSLSPSSRTSAMWDDTWPYKPDIVLEGGNYAMNDAGEVTYLNDLGVLTTAAGNHSGSLLGTISDTSAATAEAARMAAVLQADHPNYWPETIRALLVHSAEWTPRMKEEFPRSERKQRVRVYGYGVPDLNRASKCTNSFATMVIQDSLNPYVWAKGDNATREMNVHTLPMPKDLLEELGSLEVTMKVTLSYFIEPNPPRRGSANQYLYASHGLRFDVRRPQESIDQMILRKSAADRPKNEKGSRYLPFSPVTDSRNWELGLKMMQTKGSIHSDSWSGTAADLATSDSIVVYPVQGWWRYQPEKKVVEKPARYALVVSISSKDTSVELHAAIESVIATSVPQTESAVETLITQEN